MKLFSFLFLCLVSCFSIATDLVDESVYQIESSWIDQSNRQIEIGELHGKIQIVAFIYTYCEHTCPTIISKLKQIKQKIPAENKDDVRVTLISLDPERDTPEILKLYMKKHNLNEKHWIMLNGSPDDVLELAALFGVRYKPMGESDIAHSNMISILDKEGVLRYQMKGLNRETNEVIKAIVNAMNSDQS